MRLTSLVAVPSVLTHEVLVTDLAQHDLRDDHVGFEVVLFIYKNLLENLSYREDRHLHCHQDEV